MDKAIDGLNSVSIYGSGAFLQLVVRSCLKAEIEIDGIYDHLNIGKVLNVGNINFVVRDFRTINHGFEVNNLILGVYNLNGDVKNIAKSIKAVSPNVNIISPVEFCNFLESIGERSIQSYWLHESPSYYKSNMAEIDSFRKVIEDEESVALYDSILEYRINGQIEDAPSPLNLDEQYLPYDLETPPRDLRMVDLGACQGENLEYFLDSGRNFQLCLMLEPDKSNLNVLVSRVTNLDLRNTVILQLAAHSSSKILKFNLLANGASAVNENSDDTTFGIALDDLLKNTLVNYIKMDIEGSELEALKGGKEIIKRDLPHLAISIYHKPSDLWEIGLYLFSIHRNKYRYYIRNYGHQTFDTVLYAIPVV
jgi:FkbM family methyltransferase